MPGCSVPKCKGNYRNGPKVSVFSFPKDDQLRELWLKGIKRDGFFTPNQLAK